MWSCLVPRERGGRDEVALFCVCIGNRTEVISKICVSTRKQGDHCYRSSFYPSWCSHIRACVWHHRWKEVWAIQKLSAPKNVGSLAIHIDYFNLSCAKETPKHTIFVLKERAQMKACSSSAHAIQVRENKQKMACIYIYIVQWMNWRKYHHMVKW